MQIQIAPDIVPRLPVLGWRSFAEPVAPLPPTLLDADHIRYTTSGRAAIGLALQVLGVGRGARVLIPTYHCPTMVAPAVFVGAEPIFFPISATGGPILDALEGLSAKSPKVLVVAHYFGIPQPMRALREFCDRRGMMLIEDCAHAIFGMSDGRPVGSWGDVAIASTPKFFATPNGGCVVSATRAVEQIALRPCGVGSELRELANMAEMSARFGRLRGINWLLSGLFAARSRVSGRPVSVAPEELAVDPHAEVDAGDPGGGFDPGLAGREATRVTRWVVRGTNRNRLVARRRENYQALARALGGLKGTRVLFPELPPTAVPYVLPVLVDNPDERYYALKRAGIPVFRWNWLWTGTPILRGDHGRGWSRHVFQLPCHQDLTTSDIALLSDRIRDVFAACPARGDEPMASITSCAEA